jgi:hypothetical protein
VWSRARRAATLRAGFDIRHAERHAESQQDGHDIDPGGLGVGRGVLQRLGHVEDGDVKRDGARRTPGEQRATLRECDRRRQSSRVRTTPASTTPTLSRPGTPPGLVEVGDEVAPTLGEPGVTPRDGGLDLGVVSATEHESPRIRSCHLHREPPPSRM